MMTGATLIGVLTGCMASWFMTGEKSKQDDRQTAIEERLARMETLLQEISITSKTGSTGAPPGELRQADPENGH
jgi:hypothetical protein